MTETTTMGGFVAGKVSEAAAQAAAALTALASKLLTDHAPRLARTTEAFFDVWPSLTSKAIHVTRLSGDERNEREELDSEVIHPGKLTKKDGSNVEATVGRPTLLIHFRKLSDPFACGGLIYAALVDLYNKPQTDSRGNVQRKHSRWRQDAETLKLAKDGTITPGSDAALRVRESVRAYLEATGGPDAWKQATAAAFALSRETVAPPVEPGSREVTVVCADDITRNRTRLALPATEDRPATEQRHLYLKMPERYVERVLRNLTCPTCLETKDSKGKGIRTKLAILPSRAERAKAAEKAAKATPEAAAVTAEKAN